MGKKANLRSRPSLVYRDGITRVELYLRQSETLLFSLSLPLFARERERKKRFYVTISIAIFLTPRARPIDLLYR